MSQPDTAYSRDQGALSDPMRILIIEDEFDIRDMLQMALEAEGFIVYTADDAEHGLEEYRDHRIDVILLDLMLPKITGAEFVRILDFFTGQTEPRIIVLSGAYQPEQRMRGLPVERVFPKPFSLHEVIDAIRHPPNPITESAPQDA